MPDGDAIFWLLAANAVIWLGIGCYLALLGRVQVGLARRLQQLELWRDESNS